MKKATRKGVRGSRHAPPTNAFPPGHPGGPGRPKTNVELQDAFRDRTPKALAVIDKVLDGYLQSKPTVTARDAVKASEVALARGWGAPPETVKLEGALAATVTGEVKHTHEVKPPDPKRMAKVAAVLKQSGALDALMAAAEPPGEAPAETPVEDAQPEGGES